MKKIHLEYYRPIKVLTKQAKERTKWMTCHQSAILEAEHVNKATKQSKTNILWSLFLLKMIHYWYILGWTLFTMKKKHLEHYRLTKVLTNQAERR